MGDYASRQGAALNRRVFEAFAKFEGFRDFVKTDITKLIKPFRVLLLDEITTDLDLLARHDLLTFLREESEERGVTIVYCTHIFDGLDGWASHVAYVKKGEMVRTAHPPSHRPCQDAWRRAQPAVPPGRRLRSLLRSLRAAPLRSLRAASRTLSGLL